MATRIEHRTRSLQQIKQAALELFVTKGYHATTLRDIASRAGLSAGNVYNYFKTKRELALDLYNSLYEELTEQEWEAVRTEGDMQSRVYRLVEQFFQWVKRSPHAFLYLFGFEIAKVTEDGKQPPVAVSPGILIERLIIEGQAAGKIKNISPPMLIWAFFIAVEIARFYAAGWIEGKDLDLVAPEAAEMIWGAIRAD